MASERPSFRAAAFELRSWKSLRDVERAEAKVRGARSYAHIEAGPSTRPARALCDLTGRPARYRDAQTGLRYCRKDQFRAIRTMDGKQVKAYLALRGADGRHEAPLPR